MAQLGTAIDVDNIPVDERDGNFEPIPAGVYDLHIIESNVTIKERGVNEMLSLQIEIIGPSYAKRQIFENLSYLHPNVQAQDIANKTIKKICAAVGHHGPLHDSADLHFKPAKARVGIEPPKNGYAAKNKISAWLPQDANVPASVAQPRQAAQPAQTREPAHAAAGGGTTARKRPWG